MCAGSKSDGCSQLSVDGAILHSQWYLSSMAAKEFHHSFEPEPNVFFKSLMNVFHFNLFFIL